MKQRTFHIKTYGRQKGYTQGIFVPKKPTKDVFVVRNQKKNKVTDKNKNTEINRKKIIREQTER